MEIIYKGWRMCMNTGWQINVMWKTCISVGRMEEHWMNEYSSKRYNIELGNNTEMNWEPQQWIWKLRNKDKRKGTYPMLPTTTVVPWMFNSTNLFMPSHEIMQSSSKAYNYANTTVGTRMAIIQWSENFYFDFMEEPSRCVVECSLSIAVNIKCYCRILY